MINMGNLHLLLGFTELLIHCIKVLQSIAEVAWLWQEMLRSILKIDLLDWLSVAEYVLVI